LLKHIGTTRRRRPVTYVSVVQPSPTQAPGKQNAQLCATRSATQGGTILRQNGGSGRKVRLG